MSDSLFDALPRKDSDSRIHGVVTGVVTNNRDPEKLGRVRVRFPWLADNCESGWARIASPMAGALRGAFFLPDVDDEVLVAFEHGDIRFPYIVGCLWSSKQPPPESNDDGKNAMRLIKSRSGNTIRFDDTQKAEKIEIIDSSGLNSIVIDIANNTVTISAETDISTGTTVCQDGVISTCFQYSPVSPIVQRK